MIHHNIQHRHCLLVLAVLLGLLALLIAASLFALSVLTAMAEGESDVVHIVTRGETLSGIARRYGVAMEVLVLANDLPDANRIYVGQKLVIPATVAVATTTAETSPTAYIVQRGDNLSRIARRHNVSLAALLAANPISKPDTIFAGMVLTIPAPDMAVGEPAPADGANQAIGVPTPTVAEGKQVIVVLSQQRVYAFENGALVQEFLVSTGLPGTPTVQGKFAIYRKVESQRMTGSDYDLPDVPWVSYFYRDYSFHGTYWHSNFGHPMSHGCINMRTEDAKWLYDWAPLGTPVLVVN